MAHRPRTGADAAARVLLVDRDAAAARALSDIVSSCVSADPCIETASGGKQAAMLLREGKFDLVLADLASLADLAATTEDAVARLTKLAEGALIIALAAGGSVSATLAAMRAGAHDVMTKPIEAAAFAARIGELAQRHGGRTLTFGKAPPRHASGFAGFVGASSQMQFVYEQIERIAPSPAPVFITGESGTGKSLCAEALHREGPRAAGPFVAVHCAAIPRQQLEAELFGVAGGALTGSDGDRRGAAELADGGTLFIDEIGELDLSLQAKLLRLLQSGAVSRIGDASVRPVDMRLICTTNRNPMQLIAEKRLREDLFYRLHVLPIHLPPLRQRPADVVVLARHFLVLFSREEHKLFAGFGAAAADALVAHEWPGNVRQLMNLMHRIVVMFEGGEVTPEMIAAADIERFALAQPVVAPTARQEPVLPMWRQEQRIIEEAIESCGGNIAMAAAALELSPSTIYRKRQAWAEMDGKRGAA